MPQDSALSRILRYASDCVHAYRGLSPRISDFPIVSKRNLIASLEMHLGEQADPRRRALAQRLQADSLDTSQDFGWFEGSKIHVHATSGSSGLPFRIPKTTAERTSQSIATWRYRCSLDATVRPDRLYPLLHEPVGFSHRFNPRDLTSSNLANFYGDIRSRGITWLHVSPKLFLDHCRILSNMAGIFSGIRFVEFSGFHVSPQLQALVNDFHGLSQVNQYGCQEVGAIAYAFNGAIFQEISESVYIEIVNDHGANITAPGVAGRLIVTSLNQRLLPIIRYDTGDFATWTTTEKPAKFQLLPHRDVELLHTATGKISGTEFFKRVLVATYDRLGHVHLPYLQFRQLRVDHVEILLSRADIAHTMLDTVQSIARSLLGRQPGGQMQFSVRVLNAAEENEAMKAKPLLFVRLGPR